MPIFKTEAEAQEAHRYYIYDTDEEGKFSPTHIAWNRTWQIIEWIPNNEPIILSVGCNTGGLERVILREKPGSVVYGIDIQAETVRRARQKGVIARVGTAEKLPYEDRFFDIVILSEVLEHVFDPKKVMKESLRVLKREGLVIGSVPHPESDNAKKGIEKHPYHARIFTKQGLRKAVMGDIEIVDIYHNPDFNHRPQWMCFKGEKC